MPWVREGIGTVSNDALLLILLLVFTYLVLCAGALPAHGRWGDKAEDERDL